MHGLSTSLSRAIAYRRTSIILDGNLVRVLQDIRIDRIDDRLALPASNFKNQMIQASATEDINVITGIGPAAWIEAIGLVRHFVGDDGDFGGVVT